MFASPPPIQLRNVLQWTYDNCNMFYPYRNMALNKAKYGGGSLVPSSTLRPPAAGGSLHRLQLLTALRPPAGRGRETEAAPPFTAPPTIPAGPSATPSGESPRAPSEERHPSCGEAAAGPSGGPLRAPSTMLESERSPASHGGAAERVGDGPFTAAGGGSTLVSNGSAVGGLGRQLMVYPDPTVR